MLTYIPHTMSRKRNMPFLTMSTQTDVLPSSKKSRQEYAYSSYSSAGEDNHHSLDLVVLSRSSRSRRMASVRAQIANTSLLIEEHQLSRSPSPSHLYTEEDEAEMEENSWKDSLPTDSERPQQINLSSRELEKTGEQATMSCSPLSPLSSLCSECNMEKFGDIFKKASTHPQNERPVFLKPVIECGKKTSKPRAKKYVEPPKLNGYVRRIASLNARACVSAMMEPTRHRRSTKRKAVPSETPQVPTSEIILNSSTANPEHSSPGRSPVPHQGVVTRSRQNSAEKDEISDTSPSVSKEYVLLCASPNTLTACGIIQGSVCSELSPINAEGLLWNGGTIHPQSRVYLTPEGTVPQLIVPPVCPTRPNRVLETIALAKTLQPGRGRKQKAKKVICKMTRI